MGAAGGVGLAAVELGKIMGAKVIAAASTDEKLELCKKYGADEVINYSTENLKDRIKEITGGKGVNVVCDPVGGQYAEPAFRSIAWKGRYLVVGFAAGGTTDPAYRSDPSGPSATFLTPDMPAGMIPGLTLGGQ